jgi:hypothetical protein
VQAHDMPKSKNMYGRVPGWLPAGKRGAICFSIDDVHPGLNERKSGGDLKHECLEHLRWLLDKHTQLRATLFTTADWLEMSPLPTRRLLARIPYLRDRFFLAEIHPTGTMRLSNHPGFVQFLKQLPRVDIGLHGLHHVQRGRNIPVEFQKQGAKQCKRALREMLAIFDEAGLKYTPVMAPPGWVMTEHLASAMIEVGIKAVASARDIRTPIDTASTTNMSGLKGVSLIYPESICRGRLLHVTSNFQATSTVDRALEIIEHGGLLSIKAHAAKHHYGHTALDGMDELYRNYLDMVFTRLDERYGDSLWWTSMGEIADRCLEGREDNRAAKAGAGS